MILILDHRDSFTWNLAHWLSPLDEVRVVPSEESSRSLESEARLLVFSPGPGHPRDYPLSMQKLKGWQGKKPILGICLGMQMLIELHGGSIKRLNCPHHGLKESFRVVNEDGLHRGMKEVVGARYHSLGIASKDLPAGLELSVEDSLGTAMGVFIQNQKTCAVQYHPESFLCTSSPRLLENLARWF